MDPYFETKLHEQAIIEGYKLYLSNSKSSYSAALALGQNIMASKAYNDFCVVESNKGGSMVYRVYVRWVTDEWE